MTCSVLWVRDEFVIIPIHDGLRAILGSARQLVCRTRAREATVLNRGLQAGAPLGTSDRGFLVGHGAGGVAVYSIDDPFFLRTTGRLESMLAHIRRPARTLILRMGNVPFVDATGIFALREIVAGFKRHGATVVLVEVRPCVLQKLHRAGVIADVGADNVIDTLEHAQTRTNAIDLVRHQ
jgi:MFS superfamily sulfate permease-like transporter